jgi:single-stranded DNA-specific DHH superfamily exonuclease
VKRSLIALIVCIALLPSTADSQTRKRSRSKSSAKAAAAAAAAAAEKQLIEVRAGRERIAIQIKALSQFLFLLGGISKSIETAEQLHRNHEESALALPVDQIERNKIKLRESFRSVSVGLNELESSFRSNAALQSYYPILAGVARIGQTAESQAASNKFDDAGRSLTTAVNKLADALAALR